MTRSPTPVLAAACALALLLAPGRARADCALGPTYRISVPASSNTVSACLLSMTCASAGNPLLRQDEATGEVVVVEGTCDSGGCLQDACVPAGTYRYGLLTPETCASLGDTCSSDIPYFGEVTVTNTLPASCTGGTTMATTMVPPWGAGGKGAMVTQSLACPGKSGCGCTTVGKKRGAVLAIDLLVAGAGLLAMRLGARRRRGVPHRPA
jgi:hypothetical protein